MEPGDGLHALVINFNAPEINHLAAALSHRGQLRRFVRPYVNRGRAWERLLARMPLIGTLYAKTFGRRTIADPLLLSRTQEAGVWPDFCGTALSRLSAVMPDDLNRRWVQHFNDGVRHAVAKEGLRQSHASNCVISYQGFALPAFRAMRQRSDGKCVLNFPIAHHRLQRSIHAEERDREPEFASTWLGLEHWKPGYEEQLDEEIHLADLILVGSSYVADSFTAQGVPRERLEIVPYGVDLRVFGAASERHHETGDFEVVFAGQLSQRKGLSYLLRGYQQFSRPGARLTLVGSLVGNPAPLAPFAGLFRHLPHVTRVELAKIFRASSVFVFPTLLEGMPLVVLEAMACGLPVIVTAHGPAGIVRDGIDGFIVPIRDEEAICARLDQLFRNPMLCRQMGENARLRALEFSWETYGAKASEVLSQLVNRSKLNP